MKRFKRYGLILFTMLATLMALHAVVFLNILFKGRHLERADLIVAFQGRAGRAAAAYRLANEGYASHLVISPATDRKLRAYDRAYESSGRYDTILEEKARTTFENALYTKKILDERPFEKVIVVTSWNHIPRSYLLLKMMLLGSNTRVFSYAVPTGRLNRDNWYRHAVGWKMVYNEMVEWWGSLVEYVQYQIEGEVPATVPGDSGLLSSLKAFLLLDIDLETAPLPSP